jgi:hypothetical protein
MTKAEAARRILFLVAEVARRNFASREERRARVMAAFLVLAGQTEAHAGDWQVIDRELAKK